jgi:phospholipid/cholesterol/gamma-HCH transport system substrate-binding protein
MENKSHAMVAGAFVLLVSALLVALALWLTRDTTTHNSYEVSSREAVTGLQPQASVRFRGVRVGKVTAIGFDPVNRGNVLISISTNEDAPVSKSTFATLGFQGVTGLAFIQLDDTGESPQPLATSDEAPARIPMRDSLLSRLTDQGTSILLQVEETSRRVNQLLGPDNQKVLLGAVQNIGQAADSIQRFSNNADKAFAFQFDPAKMNLPRLAGDMGDTLQTLQATARSIDATAQEAKALASDFKQLSQNLSKPGGALDKLAEGADALTSVGQSLNGATLPRLNRTTDDAARAARQVSRVVTGLGDNPQSLIYGNGSVRPGPGEPGFATPNAGP